LSAIGGDKLEAKSGLNELVRAHLAVVAMIEVSKILSLTTRQQLETLREELER